MDRKTLIEGTTIFRVLVIEGDKALVIDCLKPKAPRWKLLTELDDYRKCTEEYLQEKAGKLSDLASVDKRLRTIALQRFTVIAGILPVIGEDQLRNRMIRVMAKEHGISRQTVCGYLYKYLVYQSVSALLPAAREYKKPLSPDEKNFRWAINKYYYTSHKNTLEESFLYMLKERYCDADGVLNTDHPTFNQFRYFYAKYRKLQTVYISREGQKKYMRDYRPLLGDRCEYANHVGIGEIDATICDVHLIDDYGHYIGRPILAILTDSYSNGFVYGYSLTLEGGTYAVRSLLLNCLTDKVEWCRRFGIIIRPDEWDFSGSLPGTIVSDMGSEYISDTLSQITELGITLINLPPLRPDLKAIVERGFELLQASLRPELVEHGYVGKDFGERLTGDTRRNATLTLKEYETCIVRAILYHNNRRLLEEYPYTDEMLSEKVSPHAKDIFLWGRGQDGADVVPVTKKELILTLLPRVKTSFTRRGLIVNGLRYANDEMSFTEEYLSRSSAEVAFNPEQVDEVYLLRDGTYITFRLIESRFSGKTFDKVREMLNARNELVKQAEEEYLQGRLDLIKQVETVVSGRKKTERVAIKEVRRARKKERDRLHIDFVEVIENEK